MRLSLKGNKYIFLPY